VTGASVISLLLLLAISTGAPGGKKPDWVERESAEWPREMYLTGVGSADDRAAAEDRARAEIARVFTTRVASVLVASTEESTVRTGQETAWNDRTSVSDETRSTTDKVLEGVEIMQVWEDPQLHRFYALAALDRQQGAARIEDRMDAIESSAVPLRARLSAPDKASALAAALRLLRLEQDRRELAGELAIVAPARRKRTSAMEERGARELLSRTSVGWTVDGDEGGVVEDALRNAMVALGFAVRSEAAGTDLVGEAKVAVEDLGNKDGWYWSRGRVQIVLKEPASGRVFLNVSESVREAARLERESNRRALTRISDKVRNAVPAAFAAATEKP
jgi:LPP20 lipoprotein